jgi:hypothetical protein
MKKVSIVVTLTLNDDADINDVVSEMDYSITHNDVIDAEIVGTIEI